MWTTVVMQVNIDVQCGRHIFSGAFANNVKCMYTSVCGYTVHSSDFMRGIYSSVMCI